MHQKATQFHVEIRKKHLNQIFANQRRQLIILQNSGNEQIQLKNTPHKEQKYTQQQLKKKQQFIVNSIRQADTIIYAATTQYCFEKILTALKGLNKLISKLKNNKILSKIINEQIIQSPIMLSNMIFMYRLSLQLQMELTLSQQIAYYVLNIIQKIISDEKFLENIIIEIQLIQGINEMVTNGPTNKQFYSQVCYILANSMIFSEKIARLVSESNLVKNLTIGYNSAYQQIQSPEQIFNLNYLFFIKTFLMELPKQLLGKFFAKDQVVLIFKHSWKTFEYFTDQMSPVYHNNINDTILILRILLEEQFSTLVEMSKIKNINLIGLIQYSRLFGILNMKSAWYELEREILLIVDHIIFMDAHNDAVIEMVRDHNMLLIVWSLCQNHSNIILNIIGNVATVAQLKTYLKGLIPHVLLRLFYKPSKELYNILYNWFHAQDFIIKEGIDDQIITGLLRASYKQADNQQSLVLQGLIWQRLVQNGYRGNIPNHIMNSDLSSVQIISQYLQY